MERAVIGLVKVIGKGFVFGQIGFDNRRDTETRETRHRGRLMGKFGIGWWVDAMGGRNKTGG